MNQKALAALLTTTLASGVAVVACVGDATLVDPGSNDGGSGSDGMTNAGDSGGPGVDGGGPGSDAGTSDGGVDASPTGAYLLDVLGPDGLGGQAAAFDSKGNIIVALTSLGTVTIGGQTFTVDGGSGGQLVIYKLDPSGTNLLWARQFHSGNSYDNIAGVSVDATGDVYVGAQFGGPTMSIGPYVVQNPASNSLATAVFKLGGVDGAAKWAVGFDTASTVQILFSTIDAHSKGGGELLVAGTLQGQLRAQMSSGSYMATSVVNNNNGFVLDLDTGSGNALWGRSYGSTTAAGGVLSLSAVRDANDAVIIGGAYAATGLKDDALAGAQMTPMVQSANGNADAFALRVNSANPHVTSWQKSWGSTTASSNGFVSAVPAVLANGNLVFCGAFTGKANPGKGDLTSADQTQSTHDAVAWGVDPTTSSTLWQIAWGGGFDDRCVGAIGDASGDVIVIGTHSASGLMLGGLPLSDPPPIYQTLHETASDVAKLNGTTGAARWAYTATSTTASAVFTASSIDLLKSSQAVLYTGNFIGDVDFGGGKRVSGQPQGNVRSSYIVKRAR